jgi:hypothetical protein
VLQVKDLKESSDEKKGGRISKKSQDLSQEIGTGRSTRDADSGRGSLRDARRASRLMWLASSSYESVAWPQIIVNKYYNIGIIRIRRKRVEKAGVKETKSEIMSGKKSA